MSPIEQTVITTENAPKAIGPYSAGIRIGSFIFTSGQLGMDPATGTLVAGGVEAETHQALTNLRAILAAAGSSMHQIVKTTVFLRDMNDFAKMNAVYAEFFTDKFPARSAVQVAALPRGAAVEIESVAFVEE